MDETTQIVKKLLLEVFNIRSMNKYGVLTAKSVYLIRF